MRSSQSSGGDPPTGDPCDLIWIDEAQDIRFLDKSYDSVVMAALADYRGECWLSGTPGQDCAGMFYAVTCDDEEPAV